MIESAPAGFRTPDLLQNLSVLLTARKGAIVLGIKLVGAGLALVLQIALARTLGHADYCEYAYVIAWLQMLLVLSHGGFATAALRYVSEYQARMQPALIRGFLRRSSQIALLESIALALLMAGFAVAFHRADSIASVSSFLIASAALPILTHLMLGSAVVRGLGLVISSMLASMAQPALLLGALLTIAYLCRVPVSSNGALLLNLGAAVAALGIVVALQRQFERKQSRETQRIFLTREWLGTATVMAISSGLMYLQGRTGVVVSGLLLDAQAAGAYATAERLSDVALLGLISVNMLVAPNIAALYAQRRHCELKQHARLSAWGATGFMLATVIPLILFGKPVLRLFGEEFVSAYPALLILLGGVAVNAMCGSVGFLLSMTGHQRDTVVVASFSLCMNLALSLFLIPRYGIIGTAVANAASIAMWNISMLLIVRYRLTFWSCIGSLGPS